MEISRFFYGGFRSKPKGANIHSEKAINIAATLSIGKIQDTLKAQIFKTPNTEDLKTLELENWRVVKKEMLTAAHARFQFKNDKYKVNGFLPYFDHCGKYYTVRYNNIAL